MLFLAMQIVPEDSMTSPHGSSCLNKLPNEYFSDLEDDIKTVPNYHYHVDWLDFMI